MSEETKVTEIQQEEVKPERKKPGPKPKAAQTKPKEVEEDADASNESEKNKKDEPEKASEEAIDETKSLESDKEDESKFEVTSAEVAEASKVTESEGQPPISISEDTPFQSRVFTALNAPMYRASNGKGFIGYVNSGTALSDSNNLGFVKVRASVIGSGVFVGYVKHTQIRLQ